MNTYINLNLRRSFKSLNGCIVFGQNNNISNYCRVNKLILSEKSISAELSFIVNSRKKVF